MYHVSHTWIDPDDPQAIWVDSYQIRPVLGSDGPATLRSERRVKLNNFCETRGLEFFGWNPVYSLGVFKDAE